MAKSLIINSTSLSGQKLQKTITDIGSNADSEKLKTWAQGLNSLTTNNPVSIIKVETTDLLNGEASTKLSRNMQLKKGNTVITSISAATLGGTDAYLEFFVAFDGAQPSDKIFICYNKASEQYGDLYFDWWDVPKTTGGAYPTSGFQIEIAKGDQVNDDYTGTLIFYMPETDTYASETLEITVTN